MIRTLAVIALAASPVAASPALTIRGGSKSTDIVLSTFPSFVMPTANGWTAEIESGWAAKWWSVVGFASYGATSVSWRGESEHTEHDMDFGVRARVHAYGLFAGAGVGVENKEIVGLNYGHSTAGVIDSFALYDTQQRFTYELHAGFTFPKLCGGAHRPQVFIAWRNAQVGDESASSLMLELGVDL